MKHYTVEQINAHQSLAKARTIITFRNQDLLDLWEDEMQGQISDGMWENSRHTEWLWKDVWVRLGDKTDVAVDSTWYIGRKSFGMSKDLWDCIGDRLYGAESPFKTEKDVRAAWREIATAIYNAHTFTKEDQALVENHKKDLVSQKRELYSRIYEEGKAIFKESETYGGSKYLSGMSIKNPDTEKSLGYLSVDLVINDQLKAYWYLKMNDSRWAVAPGKLAEAVEKIKTFAYEMAQLR